MTEKRYKGNKYVDCYCSKHSQVLVGTEIYKYLNVFAIAWSLAFTPYAVLSGISISYKLLFICIFGIPAIVLPYTEYKRALKVMLKAEHTKKCSQKIARMAMIRASLWGANLTIMKDKDDGKRSWR